MAPKKTQLQQFRLELKKLSSTKIVKEVTKQLNSYEKRVKQVVNTFNLNSQETKKKGRKHLNQFVQSVKKAREDVEKRLMKIVNDETKRVNLSVNRKMNDLVGTLKSLAQKEKQTEKKKAAAAKAKSKKKAKAAKAKSKVKKKKRKASTKKAKSPKSKKQVAKPVEEKAEDFSPETMGSEIPATEPIETNQASEAIGEADTPLDS